jgi:hypothetical protein
MTGQVNRAEVRSLVGRSIIAWKNDGGIVTGKLVAIKGNRLIVKPSHSKTVQTKAFLPLLLFDVAAIGAAGSYGYGGFGPYPYGYGYGYPGFFL